MEIRFRVGDTWHRYQSDLIGRIAVLLTGTGIVYDNWVEQGSREGPHWRIGGTHKWWMDYKKEDEYSLAFDDGTEQKMGELRNIIIWLLGLESFNKIP